MKNLYLHQHLGIGDHIMCNGLTRILSERYKTVFLFIWDHNYDSVKFMYRDLGNKIQIIKMKKSDDWWAHINFIDSFKKIFLNDDHLRVGYDYLNNTELPADQAFYEQVGIPWEKRYSAFYVERDLKKEEEVYKQFNPTGEPYVFIHHDIDRQIRFSTKPLDFNYIINKNIKLIIMNEKMSGPHPYTIFDYMKLIENAEECHMIDSGFKCLADSFIKDKKNMFFHRYVQPVRNTTSCSDFWIIL
jgi:hypothetical protein